MPESVTGFRTPAGTNIIYNKFYSMKKKKEFISGLLQFVMKENNSRSSSPDQIFKIVEEKFEMDDFSNYPQLKIGAIVKVWDGSHNIEITTGKHRHGIDLLFTENHAMVISNSETYIMKKGHHVKPDWYIPLEYMVIFPTGEKILVARNCLREMNVTEQ